MAYKTEDFENDDKKPYDEISQSVKDSISRKFQAPIREVGVESGTGMSPDDLEALKAQARQRQEAAMWSQALSPLSQLSKPVQDPGAFAKTLQAQAESDLDRAAKEELRREQVKQTIARNRESDALKREQMSEKATQNELERKKDLMIAGMMSGARQDAAILRQEDRLDKKVQDLDKRMSEIQPGINSIKDVEDVLGFALEDAKVDKDGNLIVGGKAKDLPGVSIPGIGRVSSIIGGDARNLAAAADKIFNTVLRDRSGAAVTSLELETLKKEFNKGKFNTEAELVQGLQRYKREIESLAKSRRAAFPKEVVDTYEGRGGVVAPPKREEIITDENGIQYVIQPDGSAIRRN